MGQKTEAVRRAREAPVRLYTDFFYNKPIHWLVSAIAVTREKSASVAGAGQSIENQFRKPIYEVAGQPWSMHIALPTFVATASSLFLSHPRLCGFLR